MLEIPSTTTIINQLALYAQELGFFVTLNSAEDSSYIDYTEKVIVISSSEVEWLCKEHNFYSNEEVVLCSLAHEVGHALSWSQGQNYLNEVLAWENAATLLKEVKTSMPGYNFTPNCFAFQKKVCLASYLKRYNGNPTSYVEASNREYTRLEARLHATEVQWQKDIQELEDLLSD